MRLRVLTANVQNDEGDVGSPPAHPAAGCRIVSAELAFDKPVDGVWASDHFGAVVDLDLARDAA